MTYIKSDLTFTQYDENSWLLSTRVNDDAYELTIYNDFRSKLVPNILTLSMIFNKLPIDNASYHVHVKANESFPNQLFVVIDVNTYFNFCVFNFKTDSERLTFVLQKKVFNIFPQIDTGFVEVSHIVDPSPTDNTVNNSLPSNANLVEAPQSTDNVAVPQSVDNIIYNIDNTSSDDNFEVIENDNISIMHIKLKYKFNKGKVVNFTDIYVDDADLLASDDFFDYLFSNINEQDVSIKSDYAIIGHVLSYLSQFNHIVDVFIIDTENIDISIATLPPKRIEYFFENINSLASKMTPGKSYEIIKKHNVYGTDYILFNVIC